MSRVASAGRFLGKILGGQPNTDDTRYLREPLQAVLVINRLGPSTAARVRSNSSLRACYSTYTTTSHFLSLKAQKCDPTCPSPATGRSDTHPGPGNTTRQIRTLRRGGHVPNAPPVRVLTGQPLTSCVRARSAPLTCPAAPERLLPLR